MSATNAAGVLTLQEYLDCACLPHDPAAVLPAADGGDGATTATSMPPAPAVTAAAVQTGDVGVLETKVEVEVSPDASDAVPAFSVPTAAGTPASPPAASPTAVQGSERQKALLEWKQLGLTRSKEAPRAEVLKHVDEKALCEAAARKLLNLVPPEYAVDVQRAVAGDVFQWSLQDCLDPTRMDEEVKVTDTDETVTLKNGSQVNLTRLVDGLLHK